MNDSIDDDSDSLAIKIYKSETSLDENYPLDDSYYGLYPESD